MHITPKVIFFKGGDQKEENLKLSFLVSSYIPENQQSLIYTQATF